MRIEHHPKLNIWVREDGCIYLPQSGKHPAHWTYGSKLSDGYLSVKINGKNYKVHRLVAETFIGPIPDGYQIDHINRNRSDNRVFENLRIVTCNENSRNRADHDRVDARGGTHKYEDKKQYWKERNTRRYKTHKKVTFSDGKIRLVPNSEALELCKLPVKERTWPI